MNITGKITRELTMDVMGVGQCDSELRLLGRKPAQLRKAGMKGGLAATETDSETTICVEVGEPRGDIVEVERVTRLRRVAVSTA